MSLDRCELCGQPHPKCHGHKKHVRPPVPCMVWPPKGQDICTKHGGGASQVREAGKRRAALQEAEAELDRLGVPVEVDVAHAMTVMVYTAWGNKLLADSWLRELPADPREWADRDWTIKRISDEEGEKVVRWGKSCRDAGVGDRMVQLQEQQGQILAEAFLSYGALLAGALIQAGLAEAVVQRVVNEQARPLMRQALETAVREERE